MRMTAGDQLALGVVDLVVDEPHDGAQADPAEAARRLRSAIVGQLGALERQPIDSLVEARYRRYRQLGAYTVVSQPAPPAPERPGLGERLRVFLGSGRGALGQLPGRTDEPPAREDV